MLPAVRPVHENSNTGDECGDLIEYCSGRGFESRHLHHSTIYQKADPSLPVHPLERRVFFFPSLSKGFSFVSHFFPSISALSFFSFSALRLRHPETGLLEPSTLLRPGSQHRTGRGLGQALPSPRRFSGPRGAGRTDPGPGYRRPDGRRPQTAGDRHATLRPTDRRLGSDR